MHSPVVARGGGVAAFMYVWEHNARLAKCRILSMHVNRNRLQAHLVAVWSCLEHFVGLSSALEHVKVQLSDSQHPGE